MSIEQAQAVIEDMTARKYRICRAGTFYWKLPEAKGFDSLPQMAPGEKQDLVNQVCRALERDSRVISVQTPTIEPDYSQRKTIYPDRTRASSGELLTGADGFAIQKLSSPIMFHVNVPKKNQPLLHGNDDIPTEDYFVSWDGVTVFVLWEQDNDHVPLSGGHIVADILSTALAAMGAGLYIQACSPDCDNQFFHTVMLIRVQPESPKKGLDLELHPLRRGVVEIRIPKAEDNFDVLDWIQLDLGLESENFANVKNLGRRAMDIESSARDLMTHLLAHYYEYASVAAQPMWRALRERWRVRGWRREARQLLAGLWLSLANLEDVRRQWEDLRRDFEEPDAEYMPLFAIDYSDDVAAVQSFEVSHFDATVEQISRNLDNRAVVMATVGGALAGGLAGALVGLIH